MNKLSICISVHNTQEYLERCLKSIINQGTYDYEIILVNNGSTDDSLKIMEKFRDSNKNIIICSQEDKGLAQGRQTGINNATGEYITFIDADDYYLPDAFKTLYREMDGDCADIIEFESIHENEIIKSPFHGIVEAKKYLSEYLRREKYIYAMLWLRVYKRELFDPTVLPTLYVNNEDIFAMPLILSRAKNIKIVKNAIHVYSIDNKEAVMNSLKNNKHNYKKFHENRISTLKSIDFVYESLASFLCENQMEADFAQYVQAFIVSYILTDIRNTSFSQKIKDIRDNVKYLKGYDLMKFIHSNCNNNSQINKRIKIIGIKNVYLLHELNRIRKEVIK